MKTKHTVYLPQSTLDLLDGLWLQLRSQLKSRQITKSMIVENAVEAASQEFQKKGTESRLYENIAHEIESNLNV